MIKTILLDVDDTLLEYTIRTNEGRMELIVQEFVEYLEHIISPEQSANAMMSAYKAMDENDGKGPTNEELFFEVFNSVTGHNPEETFIIIHKFFTEEFPKFRYVARSLVEARHLIEWTFNQELEVVIATGFQTPLSVVEERLTWADVPVTEFQYTFITTWSNMHTSKPTPAYFDEVLKHINRLPHECLMVGDGWVDDIVPASDVGIPCYWITDREAQLPDESIPVVGRGNISDLLTWLPGFLDKESDQGQSLD